MFSMSAPTPRLPDLQAMFWASLADDPGTEDPERLAPGLVAVIGEGTALAPAQRLQIYARMYFWRIRDALSEDYPQLAELLGTDGFEALLRGYLRRHPSEHPSLRHAGRHLPAFLAARPMPGIPPYAPDLARLEWARVDAFDAPDAEPLGKADLHAIAPDAWATVRLTPVPALAVVSFDWPVHDVWADPAGCRPDPSPTTLRIWRQEHRVFHARVDSFEAAALERLLAGERFADVCDVFASLAPEEAASRAGGLLARWVEDGILGAVF
jgi:hypothetical protein